MGAMAPQITSLTIVYSTVYSRRRSKKTSKLRITGFVRGIHRWPVNSPHKGPVTRKLFPFDDVIMVCPFYRRYSSQQLVSKFFMATDTNIGPVLIKTKKPFSFSSLRFILLSFCDNTCICNPTMRSSHLPYWHWIVPWLVMSSCSRYRADIVLVTNLVTSEWLSGLRKSLANIHHIQSLKYEFEKNKNKKTYDLVNLNLGAPKCSPVDWISIFPCMGKILCAQFQRVALKFHTKYLTHTLEDAILIQCGIGICKSSHI